MRRFERPGSRDSKIKNQKSKLDLPAALGRTFAAAFGALLGLGLLKFGNPPIMEQYVTAPANAYEFVLGYPWPITWGYGLFGVVVILGLFTARWNAGAPRWLLVLPLVWLVWQIAASTVSVQPELSRATVAHFVVCVACFYLGYFSLSRVEDLRLFWVGLLCALVVVVVFGWQQHFGGLEETRRYFYLYVYPKMKEVAPEYLKKMSSTRIFSTLFYPNALAGVILLLLPLALGVVGQARRMLTPGARWFMASLISLGGLGCLYWSGSKGGWLLLLLLGFLALLRLPFGKTAKVALIAVVLAGGLAGFFWKYSAFFQRGSTSVTARFDYWRAAVETTAAHPVFGTGPGTFAKPYQELKRPESEMARLVHNDYLEQASDSGLAGFVTYTAFILGALIVGTPRPWALRAPAATGSLSPEQPTGAEGSKSGIGRRDESLAAGHPSAGREAGVPTVPDWITCCLWLGALGWALQSLFEFGLYIPALAWPAFTFLGLLLGRKPQES
ncbi:MAG TPA: O-antigen ligase family protein [Candidatus Acidoferrum sp.]|nr:O-antigen ligase family protein [Candidatus Acidoferrum sp.]